jgi:hypothetical protein
MIRRPARFTLIERLRPGGHDLHLEVSSDYLIAGESHTREAVSSFSGRGALTLHESRA